jgi:predicted nucleic acid-binding protein
MKAVFADSDYWIALLNPKDKLHQKAKSISPSLRGSRLVTTEMVLAEVLAGMANKGPNLRKAAIKLVEALRANTNTSVIPQTSMQFQKAFKLYQEREDKDWSLTDCASILVMQEEKISEALTHDKHFEQAGLKRLLRESNEMFP